MYILTTTTKRKNAKRHIDTKGKDLEKLRNNARFIDRNKYVVEIYNGKWELIEIL